MLKEYVNMPQERDQFSEEFIRYFEGLSEADLRTRPHARHFYHEILVPRLRTDRDISATALKELISDYQRGKKGANFDLVTLHGFAYIDYLSRRDAKYRLSPKNDPEGFEVAKKARELIEDLWVMENGGV